MLVALVPPRAVVAAKDTLLGVLGADAQRGHHLKPLDLDVELLGCAALVRDA